jgi:hypothetical protein
MRNSGLQPWHLVSTSWAALPDGSTVAIWRSLTGGLWYVVALSSCRGVSRLIVPRGGWLRRGVMVFYTNNLRGVFIWL